MLLIHKKGQICSVLSAAESGFLSKLVTKGSEFAVLQGNVSSWRSCGFYADIRYIARINIIGHHVRPRGAAPLLPATV